jgi:hypothetical protein
VFSFLFIEFRPFLFLFSLSRCLSRCITGYRPDKASGRCLRPLTAALSSAPGLPGPEDRPLGIFAGRTCEIAHIISRRVERDSSAALAASRIPCFTPPSARRLSPDRSLRCPWFPVFKSAVLMYRAFKHWRNAGTYLTDIKRAGNSPILKING